MMDSSVTIYKKAGYVSYGTSDADKITVRNSLTSIKTNRAKDTQVTESTIIMEYEKLPLAAFKGGNTGIIDNYAHIEIYFDDAIQYSGVIKKYNYNEGDKTITLTCHDMFYRLLNATNEDIVYGATTAVNVIADLVGRAGLSFYQAGGDNYSISNLKIAEGTVYADVIQNFLETMHAAIRCSKGGTIILEDQYPAYIEGGGDRNHFDWVYKDNSNNSSDDAGRDASLMKNILKVTCDVKNGDKTQTVFDKFEDPSMTEYLNGEKWYDIIDNPLANTQEKRKAVAGWQFLEHWRKSTPLTILPTKGNKNIDLGHVVKLIRDNTDPGYYLVVGIDTEVTADGYQDTLQLEGMRDKNTIYLIPKLLASGVMKEAS
ncbi:hypothetical protein [Clostridium ljungdahlii]|uniref:Uncharacterized protein n=1 Tax=Clostridium ljungdahlii TaxID=1538 RepID=A0A162J744_9CLOT|nr:hypothetical protein [Clostridium ljungdahlii]OAA91265.1 hypothetical protein WY13_00830 [Clostridium ljungdahlii]